MIPRVQHSSGLALPLLLNLACNSTSPDPEPACFVEYEAEPEPAALHPEPTECDPRDAPSVSSRIQPPVLVGEHPDGTLYVLDRIDDGYSWPERPRGQDVSPRLFISSEQQLIEHEGGGGVGSAYTEEWGFYGTADGVVRGSYRLRRDRDRAHVEPTHARMGLQESQPGMSDEDPPDQGLSAEEALIQNFEQMTPLRVLPECAVEDFEVVFLPPGPRRIAYVAEDDRGHHILVTEPARHFDAYDFKVFYGPAGRVLERPTAEPVARERDGGTTTIRFRIDGEPAELYFPARRWDDGSERQATITLPDGTLNVTRLSDVSPSQELPAAVTYICQDQAY